MFRDYNHMAAEVERDDLDVTPDHVLVLQNAGPKGGPGMPEWGMLPIPRKLVRAGVRDMLRISDARMSGTSYGACILHVAPESFVGGPLALVETGDEIEVDVAQRRLHLHVSDEELARRRAAWVPPAPRYERGYGRMFQEHIGQADAGCDFDFLEHGASGAGAGDSLRLRKNRKFSAKRLSQVNDLLVTNARSVSPSDAIAGQGPEPNQRDSVVAPELHYSGTINMSTKVTDHESCNLCIA